MKTKLNCFIYSLALLGALNSQLSTVFAQNTTFTYQGRVLASGTNFTGTGQFQFALVTSTNLNHTAAAAVNYTGPLITSYNVLYGGNGYVTAPAVTITGGGGSGATATANISGGVVTSIVANIPGSGYTFPPMVTVAAPPANLSYTTYWSNDGTSVNGSEPSAIVGIGVTNGLFTVVLGDPTVANMDTISAALFSQPGLQLRIWFNDGTHGFAVLNPAQNLTPTPYAVYSINAGNATTANSATTATTASSAGSVAAANIVGTIPAINLPANVLTNGASGVNISGTFSGNGAGVTNVNLTTLNGNGYLTWGNFVLSSSPGVGSEPSSVVAADVNGDGKVDLISANSHDYTLTVLTNNGSGGFTLAAAVFVGPGEEYPTCVAAADVNGDGKVDLISANYRGGVGNTLSVLTNNGSGGFALAAMPIVGEGPYTVVTADVNGDGKVDLISANAVDDTLTVLTNNGSGGFTLAATLNAGNISYFVVAADVNGDGKPDLIAANTYGHGNNTLSVLTNNGSGGFALSATLTVGTNPLCVVAADVNGDGKVDLISANNGDNTLTVLTNNGSGVFGFNATLNVGANPACVIAADVNGDGKLDLISANSGGVFVSGGNTLTVLTNNGFGVFGSNATLNVGNLPACVIAVDVNGDGKLDLISANSGNNNTTLSVLLNTPTFNGNGSGLTGLNASQFAPGTGLSIQLNSSGAPNVIGGASVNYVSSGVIGATIAGGGEVNDGYGHTYSNSVNASFGTVGGGDANTASGTDATVGGGEANTASLNYATVGGGGDNNAIGNFATVGGGVGNTASGSSGYGYSTVGGGKDNTASADYATVGGGNVNMATGQYSTVGGGGENMATNVEATVPGGLLNVAGGQDSFAAGLAAKALYDGDFVWADSQNEPLGTSFTATGANQFLIRAAGGVGINTASPQSDLSVNGSVNIDQAALNTGTTAHALTFGSSSGEGIGSVRQSGYADSYGLNLYTSYAKRLTILNNGNVGIGTTNATHLLTLNGGAYCDGGNWVNGSDRNSKLDFAGISPRAVLEKVSALPITEWQYKRDTDAVKHIGPMAQDFHAAFGLNGADDKHISTVDEGGVALAAIQGLNQKVEEKDAKIKELEARLEKLEQLMNEQNGGVK